MQAPPLMSLLILTGINLNCALATAGTGSALYLSGPPGLVASDSRNEPGGQISFITTKAVLTAATVAENDRSNSPPEKPKLLNDPPPKIGPVIGKRGPIEVTLWWESTDDLDLVVACPPAGLLDPWEMTAVRSQRTIGGTFPNRLMGMGPGVCGDGTIDVDANRKRIHPVDHPAEHAVWQERIPAGAYTVAVRPSKLAQFNSKVSYSIRVDLNGEQKICTGQVAEYDHSSQRAGFGQLVIKFQPGQSLPDCHPETWPMFWGPSKP